MTFWDFLNSKFVISLIEQAPIMFIGVCLYMLVRPAYDIARSLNGIDITLVTARPLISPKASGEP